MSTHILRTPMHEVSRRPDGEPRWCFECRSRQAFEMVIETPIVECWCPLDGPRDENGEGVVEFGTGAYYGPSTKIECTNCKREDSDLFPGRYREWEDL